MSVITTAGQYRMRNGNVCKIVHIDGHAAFGFIGSEAVAWSMIGNECYSKNMYHEFDIVGIYHEPPTPPEAGSISDGVNVNCRNCGHEFIVEGVYSD